MLPDMSNTEEAAAIDEAPAWAILLANALGEARQQQVAFNTTVYEKLADLHPITPELMQQIVEHVTPKPGPSAGELRGRIDAAVLVLELANGDRSLEGPLGIQSRESHLTSIIAGALAVLRGPQ